MKRVISFVALNLIAYCDTKSFENSSYMTRVHKNFIKDVMDQNFAIVIKHIQSQIDSDIYLGNINAQLNSLEMQIKPIDP
jgi:hypothetical protein